MKIEKTLEVLSPFHLLKHPFYQAWMEGQLSRDTLGSYAAEYYPHVESFPRYISALHSICEDPDVRRDLAQNLSEEEGLGFGKNHPDLWKDFSRAFVSNDDLRAQATSNCGLALESKYRELMKTYPRGLGALFAYEYQVPEISQSKIEGLKKNYQIHSEEALAFFEVHRQADVDHREALARAAEKLSPSDFEEFQLGAIDASKALWSFLDEVYAQ